MRRLERLHALTDHLRARAPSRVPATQLAQRFGVSARTIERDLRALADAGVPVYGVDGRGGGYSILPDYSMAPLQLTPQEVAACLTGLALLDTSPYAGHARTALDKILAGVPDTTRTRAAAAPALQVSAKQTTATSAWTRARHERRLVRLTYGTDLGERLVEPVTVLHAEGRWYLIGWCRTREAVRGFRTDRVTHVEMTDERVVIDRAAAVAEDLQRWSPVPLV